MREGLSVAYLDTCTLQSHICQQPSSHPLFEFTLPGHCFGFRSQKSIVVGRRTKDPAWLRVDKDTRALSTLKTHPILARMPIMVSVLLRKAFESRQLRHREGSGEEIESTGGWRKTPWLIRSTSVAAG